MEIYEDHVRDLLYDPASGEAEGYNPNDLPIREDVNEGRTIIENVMQIQVNEEEMIYAKKEVGSRGLLDFREDCGEISLVIQERKMFDSLIS